jgi:hypothetical protein
MKDKATAHADRLKKRTKKRTKKEEPPPVVLDWKAPAR